MKYCRNLTTLDKNLGSICLSTCNSENQSNHPDLICIIQLKLLQKKKTVKIALTRVINLCLEKSKRMNTSNKKKLQYLFKKINHHKIVDCLFRTLYFPKATRQVIKPITLCTARSELYLFRRKALKRPTKQTSTNPYIILQ